MTELLDLAGMWPELVAAVGLFGFAPGFCLRLIVLVYPRGHPRRRELVAELYGLPYVKRPIWVAAQLETALFEGVGARLSQLRRRLRRAGKAGSRPVTAGASSRVQVVFVHRAPRPGVVGNAWLGAESIVLGPGPGLDFVVYTGQDGREGGRQVADQSFDSPGNAALRTSWLAKRPVRIVRKGSYLGARYPLLTRAYRDDGDYLVVAAWAERNAGGRKVCRFVLVRCGSPGAGGQPGAA
ncbi:YDG/SRA domain-containing protein [Amycolatopsis sp. OK19-0408]|uniref:YDG/SRA domain-containing protein n=1 Tax=Amycolatopsis iheyensis TaxID=2945988 RepID=A0A9X2NL47_9PSEU|nr:YDG/SRA domain-containing protein [Amycolatopsis iheyensis]MCR6486810.1 YDG/SRA domain-containing protein [Amycolatopsis iheyensis]